MAIARNARTPASSADVALLDTFDLREVTVQDAGGNTVTGDTSSVTLALTTPGGASLTCTTNPLAAVLGPPARSHYRLTLSQAFNSLGTVIAPYLGSMLMLRGGVFDADSPVPLRSTSVGKAWSRTRCSPPSRAPARRPNRPRGHP